MDEEARSPTARWIDRILLAAFIPFYFVSQDLIGDVSLEGLDSYVLSAPAGSTREQLDARVAHFKHCYYRSPSRTDTGDAVDYLYRGTTSDVGYFVSVKVHCPFGAGGTLAGQCTRSEWELIPSDVDAQEKKSGWLVNSAPEYSNAGQPECPVED
jgi:hypothetical protein